MHVLNIHERELPAESGEVGALIDSLTSRNDRLWPGALWPAMRFDRPLAVGAVGGHGPIRYVVEAYHPGRLVRFRFTAPSGFDGHHWLEVLPGAADSTLLRHTICMRVSGTALLLWPLAIRHLHDALLEDALALAQASLGAIPVVRPWSPWVKFLRWAMSGGRARCQQAPDPDVAQKCRTGR
jgi:hypothetical protein